MRASRQPTHSDTRLQLAPGCTLALQLHIPTNLTPTPTTTHLREPPDLLLADGRVVSQREAARLELVGHLLHAAAGLDADLFLGLRRERSVKGGEADRSAEGGSEVSKGRRVEVVGTRLLAYFAR